MTALPAPTAPRSARNRLRARWARRHALRAVSGLLRAAADHLDPPRRVLDLARAAGHPSVVPDTPPSIASGRADLQLVHGYVRWGGRITDEGLPPFDPDLPIGPRNFPEERTVRGGIRYGHGASDADPDL